MNRAAVSNRVNMRVRIARITFIAVFNAAFFSGVSCWSRCGFCGQSGDSFRPMQSSQRNCQECTPTRPSHRPSHDDPTCPRQNQIVLSASTSSNSLGIPGQHTPGSVGLSTLFSIAPAAAVMSSPNFSPSPPIFLNGRIICGRQSLLRI